MPQTAQYPNISDKGVVGIILQEIESAIASSWISSIANEYTSDQLTESYRGLGNAPQLREWIGEKQIKQLNEFGFTISNKDYEATLRIFRKDLRREKISQLQAKASELALAAVDKKEELLLALIDTGDDGDLGLAYDGQFFFDTDHAVGESGTLNNDITVDISALPTGDSGTHGVVTAPSPAEMALAIQQGVQQLYTMKDDRGRPKNQRAKSFLVLVPTTLWAAAQNATTLTQFANFQNPLKGDGMQYRVVQDPRLSWTDEFAVFIADSPTKPFAIQQEEGPSLESLGEGSDYAFFNAAHLFSALWSGGVQYQRFDASVLVTMT